MLLKRVILLCLLVSWLSGPLQAGQLKEIENLVGRKDAIVVADSKGQPLISKNARKPLIPASTLKILTALVALHYLQPDYRFPTDFYVDREMNLKIKGFGDPMLISEVVSAIARRISQSLTEINAIIVDDSFYAQPLVIPGVSSSTEPYDAPNGALCVNFNTVHFEKIDGAYVSAEPQTPLLPLARKRVENSNLDKGRIVLSHDENECTLYAGHLFAYFLRQAGCDIKGQVRMGSVDPEEDTLIYRHLSPFPLEEIVSKILEHSNNFTTNQILIAAGAKSFGSPGTLPKGVRTAERYADEVLNLNQTQITEGSGISRQNRMSAEDLSRVLEAFLPYRHLMRREGRTYYKTGTLTGISTRAGYIENADGTIYRFAVMLNTPGKSANRVMHKLLRRIDDSFSSD